MNLQIIPGAGSLNAKIRQFRIISGEFTLSTRLSTILDGHAERGKNSW